MLAPKLLFLLLCFTFVSRAQQSEVTDQDTLLSEEVVFRSKVARVELVRIDPVCETVKRRPRGWPFKRKYTFYSADPVLRCLYSRSTREKLKCTLDYTRLSGHIEINSEDHDSLLYLLYEAEKLPIVTMCYAPRHGILFYDDQNTELGFVEICFECSETRTSLNVPEVNVLNDQSFGELRKLFAKYNL